jgi:glycosyltransferase involved in cell wall biosynthesis
MNYPDIEHYRNFMSPTKLFAYMAGKRLIVSTDLPTIRAIADDTMVCYTRTPSVSDLAAALAHAIGLKKEDASAMIERAYGAALAFTWQNRAERIISDLI